VDSERLRERLRGAAAWLDASPSEVAGLLLLLLGGLAVLALLWWSDRPAPPPATTPGALHDASADDAGSSAVPTGADTVTLHVAGAVARPGLVEVPVGARVADALHAAGGLLLDAEVGGLNLARPVSDGERLDVPRVGEVAAPSAPGQPDGADGSSGAVRADGTIDLNAASAADLEELPGVGPVLAQRIVEWREVDGPFTEVGQLREVSGIGEKTFQRLAPLVGV
jgi:competence protein ComEA